MVNANYICIVLFLFMVGNDVGSLFVGAQKSPCNYECKGLIFIVSPIGLFSNQDAVKISELNELRTLIEACDKKSTMIDSLE